MTYRERGRLRQSARMLGVNGSSAVLTVPCSGETSKHHKTLPALTLMTDYYYAHTHVQTHANAGVVYYVRVLIRP